MRKQSGALRISPQILEPFDLFSEWPRFVDRKPGGDLACRCRKDKIRAVRIGHPPAERNSVGPTRDLGNEVFEVAFTESTRPDPASARAEQLHLGSGQRVRRTTRVAAHTDPMFAQPHQRRIRPNTSPASSWAVEKTGLGQCAVARRRQTKCLVLSSGEDFCPNFCPPEPT
jgi:hypothetical protein